MSDRTFRIVAWVGIAVFLALFWVGVAWGISNASPRWAIGFRVTTEHPSNVVIHWTLECDGTIEQGRIYNAVTPIRRTFAPTVAHPTSCHLRVVAWNPPPGTARPHVTTWVRP